MTPKQVEELKGALWYIFHNLIAHPLLVFIPPLGQYLRDYSAQRMLVS